jgi:flavin reductase (DIM6/NTAB) family NADH-FMN oxidoreductase RutF
MFYDTKLNNHNLPYNPFKSCIVPRPIAWISTISEDKVVNIAPYSYFNAVSDLPPVIMFASAFKGNGDKKDSIRNIEATGEFVVNLVSYDLIEKMNLSSSVLDHGVSEAEMFDIVTESSNLVKAPKIKDSPISLECKYLNSIDIEVDGKNASSQIILGHVVGVHIKDEFISNGKVDVIKLSPVARLGYNEYTLVNQIFKMSRK